MKYLKTIFTKHINKNHYTGMRIFYLKLPAIELSFEV